MTFAPEDKKAWQVSEVMAELEKIAAQEALLDGPPPEAFEPIQVKEADEAWEDEGEGSQVNDANDAPLGMGELNGLTAAIDDTKAGIRAMAENLARVRRLHEAHCIERALVSMAQINDADMMFERIMKLADDLVAVGYKELAKAVDGQADRFFRRTILEQAANKPRQEEGDAPHQS